MKKKEIQMKIKGAVDSGSNILAETIDTGSALGQRLERVNENSQSSYLLFDESKMKITERMTLGRDPKCNIVIDNKLVSRHHATIQKIKDDFYIKDEESTNGTFVNGTRIEKDKFMKINPGDKIAIGTEIVVMAKK